MSTQSARSCSFLHVSSERPSNTSRHGAAQRFERPRPAFPVAPPRSARIDRKVGLARQRLAARGAGPRDIRYGLLRIAVLRSDEILVDGILASLGGDAEPNSDGPERKARDPQLWARVVA
jgi:hypothetical protein